MTPPRTLAHMLMQVLWPPVQSLIPLREDNLQLVPQCRPSTNKPLVCARSFVPFSRPLLPACPLIV